MQLRSNWINKFNTNFLFYKTKLVHSTALFFCVLFSLISNHFFAQFLYKRKLFRT